MKTFAAALLLMFSAGCDRAEEKYKTGDRVTVFGNGGVVIDVAIPARGRAEYRVMFDSCAVAWIKEERL